MATILGLIGWAALLAIAGYITAAGFVGWWMGRAFGGVGAWPLVALIGVALIVGCFFIAPFHISLGTHQ